MTRGLVILLAVLVVLGVSVACAVHQPVQHVSPSWTLPARYADVCQVRGDRVWLDGRWHVLVFCKDGIRLLDERTKQQTEFVSWEDIGR